MKAIALLLTIFFIATSSYADHADETVSPKDNQVVSLPIMVDCGSEEIVAKMLYDYQEVPMAQGQGTWKIPGGALMTGQMIVWVNVETNTFSITVQPKDDMVCIFLPGKDFGPIQAPGAIL